MKIVPIKNGIEAIKEGKKAKAFNLSAGIEIEVPNEIIEKLKKKGYIGQSTKKTIKQTNKKESD